MKSAKCFNHSSEVLRRSRDDLTGTGWAWLLRVGQSNCMAEPYAPGILGRGLPSLFSYLLVECNDKRVASPGPALYSKQEYWCTGTHKLDTGLLPVQRSGKT